MKKWIIVLSLLLGIVDNCQAVDSTNKPITDPELIQLREGLINSFKAKDMDIFVGHLSTNVVMTLQNGEVCEGRESVKEWFKKMTEGERPILQKISVDPKIISHQLRGDSFFAWGEMNDQCSLGKASNLQFRSRFTLNAHRSNNRWLVTSLHVSANVFENPMLTSAIRRVATFGGVLAGLLGLGVGFSFGRSWKTRETK